LHFACYGYVVTNLDFVELLLAEGADPNSQDHLGNTSLMCTSHHVCFWCGQISTELAYHGRQHYHSIWSVLREQASLGYRGPYRQSCTSVVVGAIGALGVAFVTGSAAVVSEK
jgi:hypothetical protein